MINNKTTKFEKEVNNKLKEAIQSNNREEVKRLIPFFFTTSILNAQDPLGNTLLHYACETKNIDVAIVKLLIEKGTDPKLENKRFENPLHIACKNSVIDVEIIKLLIEKDKTCLEKENSYGDRPLHNACASENTNIELIRLLINENAASNNKNTLGKTPLHIACENENSTIETIQLLINEKTNFSCSTFGATPLLIAMLNKNKNIEIIKFLIINGNKSSLNESYHGKKPLSEAYKNFGPEIIKLLIENGANPNIEIMGKTPLHIACMNGDNSDIGMIHLLIAKNADIKIKDDDGLTALDYISKKFTIEKIKKLLTIDAILEEQHYRNCHAFTIEIIKLLMQKNADLNSEIYDGETLLHIACKNPNITFELLESLIQKKANLDLKDKLGKTPVNYALEKFYCSDRIKKLLAENISDPNIEISKGKTLVHIYCDTNYFDEKTFNIFKILIGKNANMNLQDDDGKTPLHLLCNNRYFNYAHQVISFCFEKCKIDTHILDSAKMTPLHYAIKIGNDFDFTFNLMTLFFEHGADYRILKDQLKWIKSKNHAIMATWLLLSGEKYDSLNNIFDLDSKQPKRGYYDVNVPIEWKIFFDVHDQIKVKGHSCTKMFFQEKAFPKTIIAPLCYFNPKNKEYNGFFKVSAKELRYKILEESINIGRLVDQLFKTQSSKNTLESTRKEISNIMLKL